MKTIKFSSMVFAITSLMILGSGCGTETGSPQMNESGNTPSQGSMTSLNVNMGGITTPSANPTGANSFTLNYDEGNSIWFCLEKIELKDFSGVSHQVPIGLPLEIHTTDPTALPPIVVPEGGYQELILHTKSYCTQNTIDSSFGFGTWNGGSFTNQKTTNPIRVRFGLNRWISSDTPPITIPMGTLETYLSGQTGAIEEGLDSIIF